MYQQALSTGTKIFATAPMIDWSDRHYRHFARQLTKNAVLYTEMIVADAILRGNRDKLLGYRPGRASAGAAARRQRSAKARRGGADRRRFRL